MIEIAIEGADALSLRLRDLPDAVSARLTGTMARLAQSLYARVEENLAGAVLQSRSGNLARAIEQNVDGLTASVSVDGAAAPYAAAQEFGATIPAHLIAAKNARSLAFLVGGRRVFARSVQFPGAQLPARSFLRSALADLAAEAENAIAATVAEALP